MRKNTLQAHAAIVAAAGLALAGQALGANVPWNTVSLTWTGAGDGTSWNQATNWSTAVSQKLQEVDGNGDLLYTDSPANTKPKWGTVSTTVSIPGNTLGASTTRTVLTNDMTYDSATFNATGIAHPNITIDANRAIMTLYVGMGYTVGSTGGQALTLKSDKPFIWATTGSGSTGTISAPLYLASSTATQNNSGQTLVFNGNISGPGNIHVLNSSGTFQFNGSRAAGGGGYSSNGGTASIYINNTNHVGISQDVTKTTFILNAAGAVTNANINAGRGGYFDLAVTNALTGTSNLSGSASTSFGGQTTGTLIQADQNYTGTTTITGATWVGAPAVTAYLRVNNGHASSGSATGTGNVAVTGALLAGDGRIANTGTNGVTLSSNAAQGFLSPGATDGTVGTLAFALGTKGLNISSAVAGTNTQALLFDLDTPAASDLVTLAGKLSFGSGKLEFDDFNFNPLGGFGAGTYTLFQTNTAITDTLTGILSGTVGGLGATLSLENGNKDVVLTVVPEPASLGLLALGALGLLGRRRRMV